MSRPIRSCSTTTSATAGASAMTGRGRARFPPRPARGGRAPRRRRAPARGRPHGRGEGRARAAGRGRTATDPAHLVRLAWHLGNRHLPVAARRPTGILHPPATTSSRTWSAASARPSTPVEAPFDPEGGAYGHGHGHHTRRMATASRARPWLSRSTTANVLRQRDLRPRAGPEATRAGPPAPPRLAVAVLPGRRLQLQPRSRMGDRGRHGDRRRRRSRPGSATSSATAPAGTTRSSSPTPSAAAADNDAPRSATSPSSPPPSSRRRSAISNRRRRAAAFLTAVTAAWPNPRLAALRARPRRAGRPLPGRRRRRRGRA